MTNIETHQNKLEGISSLGIASGPNRAKQGRRLHRDRMGTGGPAARSIELHWIALSYHGMILGKHWEVMKSIEIHSIALKFSDGGVPESMAESRKVGVTMLLRSHEEVKLGGEFLYCFIEKEAELKPLTDVTAEALTAFGRLGLEHMGQLYTQRVSAYHPQHGAMIHTHWCERIIRCVFKEADEP